MLSGAAITFTATLHDTVFSQVLFALSVLAVAVAELTTSLLTRVARKVSPLTLIQALIAVVAGVVIVLTMDNFAAFTLTVTVWAALTAVIEVWFAWKGAATSPAREVRVIGVFSGLLALLLVIVPSSPTSVIGFYGGYCFVVGVYLAIAAFDRTATRVTESEQ